MQMAVSKTYRDDEDQGKRAAGRTLHVLEPLVSAKRCHNDQKIRGLAGTFKS